MWRRIYNVWSDNPLVLGIVTLGVLYLLGQIPGPQSLFILKAAAAWGIAWIACIVLRFAYEEGYTRGYDHGRRDGNTEAQSR